MAAQTLGAAVVDITANMQPLKNEMGEWKQEARRQGDAIGSAFGLGFASPVLNSIGAVDQLTGGLRQAASFAAQVTGVGLAANYQRLEVGLRSLTGSASAAKSLMNDLANMGAQTPFRTEELTAYAMQLLSLGISAKSVKGDLLALADATAARGGSTENLGEFVRVVAGFRTRPRLDQQEVGELGRFIDLAKVVGAATGRHLSVAQARGVLTGMSGESASETLFKGAHLVYGGAAAGQGSQTVTGLTQNLGESIGLAMRSSGNALLGPIASTEGMLTRVAGAFRSVNEATGGRAGLVGVLVGANVAIRVWGGGIATAYNATRSLTSAMTQYSAAAERAAVITGERSGLAAGGLGEGMVAGGAILNSLKTYGPLIGGSIAMIVGGAIAQKHPTAGAALSNIGLGAILGAQLGSIIPGIGTLAGAGIGSLLGILPTINGYMDSHFQKQYPQGNLLADSFARSGNTLLMGIGYLMGGGNDGSSKTAKDEQIKATRELTETLKKVGSSVLGGGSRARSAVEALDAEYAFARGYSGQAG